MMLRRWELRWALAAALLGSGDALLGHHHHRPLLRHPPSRSRGLTLHSEADEAAPELGGDWRSFRAKLVAGGIATTTEGDEAEAVGEADEAKSSEAAGVAVDDKPAVEAEGGGSGAGAATGSVSKRNEALLRTQNPGLFKEYMEGMWAHEIGAAEVGSLLVRLPFETQITMAKGPWRDLVMKKAR